MHSLWHRRDFLKQAAAAATVAAAPLPLAARTLLPGMLSPGGVVSFDARSFLVRGKRLLIICGEMHYSRSTREMWPALLDRSKALGVNTVAAYVFWNVHEPSRGVFDFTGNADLRHFLELCRQRDLYVLLRVGPYCCAEWNYGGFPPYLRDEPGITIRTMNEPYLARVELYFQRLAAEVKPMLASEGGPVILVQVENEYANVAKRYGTAGQEYLRWMVELAHRVGFGAVPLTECEGGAPGAIETGNGDTFPFEKIARFRAKAPHAPLFWSESYPGWYEIWGGEAHTPRDPRELAYDALDFVAGGGSGWNYYMWHGGTNFGRTSMYLQTTSYDFHAPLDEYGRPTLIGLYLGRLHDALAKHADLLLSGEYTRSVLASGAVQAQWKAAGRTLTLVVDPLPSPSSPAKPAFAKARLLDPSGQVAFDTERDFAAEQSSVQPASSSAHPWQPCAGGLQWTSWSEPFPPQRAEPPVRSDDPLEQLSLTKDHTDYCWYTAAFTVRDASPNKLTIPYGGDFFYLFIDGKLIDQTATPLHENRGPITPEDPAHPRILANRHEKEVVGFHHEFRLPALPPGQHRLDLLCTAMGMVKGDWQIASPMNFERKGIWEGVQVDGVPLKGWEMRPFLAGETADIVGLPHAFQWKPAASEPALLTWHRARFALPAAALAADADFRLNAGGLGKGLLFVNGQGLGRHWLVLAQGPGGQPTQQFYHIPRAWLRPQNELMIFEEQNRSPNSVAIETRTYSL